MRTLTILSLIAGCGDSGSSSGYALAALCKSSCDKDAACGRPTTPDCQTNCRTSFFVAYNDDVLRGIKSCIDQADCTGGTSSCVNDVISRQPRRPVDDAYDRACLTRLSACPGATFECGKFTNLFTESFIKERLQPCLDLPCDQVKSCEENLF